MNGPEDPQQPPSEQFPQPSSLYEQPVEPASRASRAKVTAIILVVLALLAGGGAALVLRATNAEQSLDKFVPDSVAAFIKVALRPSSSQQDAVKSLISKLPSDLRSQVQPKIDTALQSMFDQIKLSYAKDVKPWLGGQLAVAILPPGGATSDNPSGRPTFIGLVTVKDATAAQTALDKAHKQDPTTVYKLFGNVAYLGATEPQIDSFRSSVTVGHTLADSTSYKSEYQRIGANSIVFAYVNFAKLPGFSSILPGGILGGSFSPTDLGVVTFSLQASSNGLTFTGRASVKNLPKTRTFKPRLLESTSADLLGSLSVFDLGTGFESFLKVIQQFGGGGFTLPVALGQQTDPVTQALQQFQHALGLDLKKDVLPWLHGELSVIIGPETQPPLPDIGILIDPTDDAALGRTLKALRAHLAPLIQGLGGHMTTQGEGFTIGFQGAPPVVVKRTSDRLVIATGNEFADKLLSPSGAKLADDPVYKAVVGANDSVGLQLFLRMDRLRPVLEGFAKLDDPTGYADYERTVQPYLKPIQALGLVFSLNGNMAEVRLTVTVNP